MSDEPRGCKHCGSWDHESRHCPDAPRAHDPLANHAGLYVEPGALRDVLAAVLAEVARQDAGDGINRGACSYYRGQIAVAALAIREAILVQAGGAA